MPTSPKVYRQNQIMRSIPSYIVAIFGVVICGTLAVSSLFSLAIMQLGAAENEIPEQLILASRNTLHVVPVVILLSIVFLLLSCRNISWKAANRITLAAALIQAVLAVWWKFSFKSSPVADQGTFWDVATVPCRAAIFQRCIYRLPAILALSGRCRYDRGALCPPVSWRLRCLADFQLYLCGWLRYFALLYLWPYCGLCAGQGLLCGFGNRLFSAFHVFHLHLWHIVRLGGCFAGYLCGYSPMHHYP